MDFRSTSSLHRQLFAFTALVTVQTVLLIVIKCATISAKSSGLSNTFSFSPPASVAAAEAIKLGVSVAIFSADSTTKEAGFWNAARKEFGELSFGVRCVYMALAVVYAANNELTFLITALSDPGSFQLTKAMAPATTAVMQMAFFGRALNGLQWCSIFLLTIGLIVVQRDACSGLPVLPLTTYHLMAVALALTSASSVINAQVVSVVRSSLMVQNMVLYSAGVVANIISHYITSGNPFFQGIFDYWALLTICLNAFTGLVVSALYQVSNALVKTLAACCSTALLVMISGVAFGARFTLETVLGTSCIIISTFVYFRYALSLNEHKEGKTEPSGTESGNQQK